MLLEAIRDAVPAIMITFLTAFIVGLLIYITSERSRKNAEKIEKGIKDDGGAFLKCYNAVQNKKLTLRAKDLLHNLVWYGSFSCCYCVH